MEFGEVARGYPGYSWSFPALEKGEPRRTFGTFDSRIPGGPSRGPLKDILAPEMKRHGHDLSDYPLAGHPLRWFVPRSRLAAPHVVLAGDAAGVDAFFGEGIGLALGYGDFAAKALARGFETGDLSFSAYTGDIHESRMGRSLLARWVVAQAVYRLPGNRVRAALFHHGEKAIQAFCERMIFNWAK
jgi:flavin-dependent dehydrogenase